MFARTVRPTFNASQRAVVARSSALRYSSTINSDPDVIEREKHKNLQGKQHSTQKHAPGWNEALATDAEAHVKADKFSGSPEEMASSTLEYLKKQHPDTLADQIREHTNAPSGMRDAVEGPLGALGRAAKKAADSLAKAAAESPEEVQGHLSDKGAKAEQARKRSQQTSSEAAVRADRGES